MSKTDNLGLEVPSAADKHIFSTYKDNNEIIDEAYGQYLEDQETSQENIAMIESHTAQSNHAIGSYFMLDNVLHKATSAIASGETITPGSNATPITLEQAITALNTSVQALQNSVSLSLSSEHTDLCQLATFGRIAVITARSFTSLQPQAYTNIATIPQAYRPAFDSFTIVPNYNMDHALVFRVDTSGLFRVYNYATTQSAIENTYISLLWVIGRENEYII